MRRFRSASNLSSASHTGLGHTERRATSTTRSSITYKHKSASGSTSTREPLFTSMPQFTETDDVPSDSNIPAFATDPITSRGPSDSNIPAFATDPIPSTEDVLYNIPPQADHSPQVCEITTDATIEEDLSTNLNISSDSERTEVLKHCRECIRRVANWGRLLSFCAVSGPVHFSAKQYNILAIAVQTASNNTTHLATYKTIRSTQWEFMKKHLFVKYSTIYVKGNNYRYFRLASVPKVMTVNNDLQDPRDCVRIILPSEWAKLDVQTLPLYNQLFGYSINDNSSITIEDAPLVFDGDRSLYLSGTRTLWAYYDDSVLPVEIGEPLVYVYNKYVQFADQAESDDVFFNEVNAHPCISVTLGPTWCVRNIISIPDDESDSISQTLPPNLSDDDELLLYMYTLYASHTLDDFVGIAKKANASNGTSIDSDDGDNNVRTPNDSDLFTFPGDTCTILRPRVTSDNNSLCLLIASHIWREDGRIGERIAWINRDSLRSSFYSLLSASRLLQPDQLLPLKNPQSLSNFLSRNSNISMVINYMSTRCINLAVIAFASIPQLPLFERNHIPTYSRKHEHTNPMLSNKGVLSDGTPYLIYRFIIYNDGFKQKKSLSDRRSVNGCYILPVGLSHRTKASCTSVRTLSLGAHGQDPNEILKNVIPDIVEGSEKGFNTTDALGRMIRLFLDMIAAFGDIPALTAQGDISGHTSDAHCSFCGTVKRKGTQCPPICFSTLRHSRRPSLMRFDERMRNIRSNGVPKSVRKHLGTSCSSETEARNRFAVLVADTFRKRRKAVQGNGSGVFSAGFTYDSYLSAHVAPDHMFKGLITNVLTVCFNYASNIERTLWDKQICTEISRHNLPTIDTLLNCDKHGTYKGLNNISTSDLFCALLFSAPLFNSKSERLKDEIHPYLLPQQLQDIISLCYWCPNKKCDSDEELKYVLGDDNIKPFKYWGDIQSLSDRYINSIRNYYEKGGKYASILDKPNAHRLLEFAYCTIPTFGHTLNVVELVLEQAHRQFKEWLEKNTNHDAHLSAVDIAIAKDWMSRVFGAYTIWSGGSPEQRKSAELSLARLLLGANALKLDRTQADVEEFFNAFFNNLPDMFRSPVIEELRVNSSFTLLEVSDERWLLSRKSNIKYKQQLQSAVRRLPVHNDIPSKSQRKLITFYSEAHFERREQFNSFNKASSFTNLRVGSVISVNINASDNNHIFTTQTSASKQYFAVYGFAFASEEKWAFASRFRECETPNTFRLDHNNTLQPIRMCSSVKRVACVPADASVYGSGDYERLLLDNHNTTWKIMDSRKGFPPRLG